jgi:hypothetical protein
VVWPPPCTQGNKAHRVLAGSLIVKTTRSGLGDAMSGTHLLMGKAQGLSTELPNQKLGPCERLRRGLGGNKDLFDTSVKMSELLIEVCFLYP